MNDEPRDRDREVREIARAEQERARLEEEAGREFLEQALRMDNLLDQLEEEVAKELEVNPAAIGEIRDEFESLLGEMIDTRRDLADDPGRTPEQREQYHQSAARLNAALADLQAEFPAAEDEDN
jgi:hypothetical protein